VVTSLLPGKDAERKRLTFACASTLAVVAVTGRRGRPAARRVRDRSRAGSMLGQDDLLHIVYSDLQHLREKWDSS
jgi:hypothetical protein